MFRLSPRIGLEVVDKNVGVVSVARLRRLGDIAGGVGSRVVHLHAIHIVTLRLGDIPR